MRSPAAMIEFEAIPRAKKETAMKQMVLGAVALLAFVVFANIAKADESITLANAPPVVVKTVPEAGVADVDPSMTEIRVTFSKAMVNESWSWSTASADSFPKVAGKPHYLDDKCTCVLPVHLDAGKTYAIWVNSERFHGFQDLSGNHPAVPYLLVFHTKAASSAASGGSASK